MGTQASAAYDAVAEAPTREHRAVWFSPMLSSTWPQGAITETNAATKKKSLVNAMTKMCADGINAVYFHVRSNSDANYFSSYEPMSSSMAGKRGGTTPFDPFEYFIETAHSFGIEVYAWVNPYRYSNNGLFGDGSDLNYEVSHPEWLITSGKQIILNPGIPEVQDRIEAVVSEIATKYDIDGMIFDDYFYLSGTANSLDADQYSAYKANGGTLAQDAWRRENVNETVRRCRDAVKAARPYAVFSIGPAGRISPPNIADYGLEAGPYGDMNYSTLHADPIHWLDEGWLDFLSPQVYWHDYFNKLTEWYSVAVPHFGRHLYTSVDCSRLSNNSNEYLRQIDYMRQHLRANESGVVFFDYGAYINYNEKIDGKWYRFGEYLAETAFAEPTLQPLQAWRGTYSPVTVSNVQLNGANLSWNAPADVTYQRYAVYAVPTAEKETFCGQRKYLKAICYTNTYTDEAPEADCTYAVSVYDRYGYEYAPIFVGETAGTVAAPVATFPLSSDKPASLFDFKWTAAHGRYIIEVSDDNFATILNIVESATTSIAATDVYDFEEGKTYNWRVRVLAPNGAEAVSDIASFSASAFDIISPAEGATGVSYNPEITWSDAGEGCSYAIEISAKRDFSTTEYTANLNEPKLIVPAKTLRSGKTYYVRVTAKRGLSVVTSSIRTFSTIDRTDYVAPELINPATDGATLHANDVLQIAEWDGLNSVTIQVAATSSFPSRQTLNITLNNFETSSKQLSELKVASSTLADGNTYYVRVRGSYFVTSSNGAKNTDYSAVRSFVYSATSGVSAPEDATATIAVEDATLILPIGATAAIYDTQGRCIIAAASNGYDLNNLASGIYIITCGTQTLKWAK